MISYTIEHNPKGGGWEPVTTITFGPENELAPQEILLRLGNALDLMVGTLKGQGEESSRDDFRIKRAA